MKNLITLLLIICSSTLLAQDKVSLSLHQDAKLMFVGDKKGNSAGTINILARFKMQGNQQKYGYMVIFPEFEYVPKLAQSQQTSLKYMRYSVNIGYTFNQLIINKKVEATASIGYGWINRGITTHSFSGAGELSYNMGKLKLSLIAQLTDRTDFLYLDGKRQVRFSGFFGLEFNLN